MSCARILLVESEPIARTATQHLLASNNYSVIVADSVMAARQHDLDSFDLIIAAMELSDQPGTTLIAHAGNVPVLITNHITSLRSAIEAIKMGAADYLPKPCDEGEILKTIATLLQSQNDTNVQSNISHQNPGNIIGESAPMQVLFTRIRRVAPTEATVMILGESGTGKELAAKALHELSRRSHQPLISVNCAAIPANLMESELFGHEKGAFTGATMTRHGLVQAADGGTLFLDEIGELTLEAQALLLRVLQEGEIRRVGSVKSSKVDIRLIAATHRDLLHMTQTGKFREDLYYRLNVVELTLPPLRERGQDMTLLSETFLARTLERMQANPMLFSPQALSAMYQHHWPGNVRELENAIERAVILCEGDMITPELLGLSKPTVSHDVQKNLAPSSEEHFLQFVLTHQKRMNETQLAEKLGISRKCLWQRRKRLGIPRKQAV